MSEYALNVEKYLAHQVWFVFKLHDGRNVTTAYSKALEPFITRANCTLCLRRSHYMLDFNDFFDYATSDLAHTEVNVDEFQDKEIYLYDALPNSFCEPTILSTEDKKFSIVGAAIARNGPEIGIMAQVRTYDEYALSEDYGSIRESGFSKGLLEESHNFPFTFVLLTLRQMDNELIEVLRSEMIPPAIIGAQDYSIHSIGKDNYYANLPLHTAYPQLMKQDHEILFERDEYYFEILRLIPQLPKYYAFMYDLVLHERKKVGVKPSSTQRGKKTGAKRGRSIYKIIKSIRISYEAEEKARKELRAVKRTWTPPPYKYLVRGHWRTLQHSHWVGHDPEGNDVLGRTWIHEYEKGEDEPVSVHVSLRKPNTVIKLKQTLAYARDVVQAHTVSASGRGIRDVSPKAHSAPSPEWIYEERKKLTAGLRYLILKRDGFRCKICGVSGLEDGVRLEVDHILPLIEWGKTEEKNLRTACDRCNRGKGKILESPTSP
jgi:hypothetical protein